MFSVVILSARAANLVPCVQAVLAMEPGLEPWRILVVDDGARAEAEASLPGVRWLEGQKPFIYARNANLGIRASGEDDVILLNDDARLLTPRGFTLLSGLMEACPTLGVCSVGVQGVVGNPVQHYSGRADVQLEHRALAFVCVYLPRRVLNQVGSLDERFEGYGYEDNDYCLRVLQAGWHLAIWDGCRVDHSGHLPSTYRTRPDISSLAQASQVRFREKWGRNL